MPKVAYLGPDGSFGSMAALGYISGATLVPLSSHLAVIQAVREGSTDQGVVAWENSIEGRVTDTTDELIHGANGIYICSEVLVPVEHCLIVKRGVSLRSIKVVRSHPQALGQCTKFLNRELPDVETAASLSTAGAVKEVMRSDVPMAAIASRRAAELAGAEVLAPRIQDRANNVTRFVVLSKEDCPRGEEEYKTSICFTVPEDEKPGSFDRVSQIFANCGINKRLVESRPTKTELGKYVFLIDVDGHREDPVIKLILELLVLAGLTTILKVLGSYPQAKGRSA